MKFKCSCGGAKYNRKSRIAKQEDRGTSDLDLSFLQLHKVADKNEKKVEALVIIGLKDFLDRLDIDKVEEMIDQGLLAQVEDEIPFDRLRDDLQPYQEEMTRVLAEAGELTGAKLLPVKQSIEFDTTNPRIAQYIQNSVGGLIVGVTEDTRQTITRMIRRSFQDGLTPRQAAKGIQNVIGLTPKMEQALFNFQQKQLEKLTADKVEALVAKKRARMIQIRANAIARTELIRTVNFAQVETWKQAAGLGLFQRQTAMKEWISVVDSRTSDICNELDGMRVRLDETFWSNVAGDSFEAPPAHVNCRSGLALHIDT